MWVFRNNAMVSVVEDRQDERVLWVRARVAGDIQAFFKGVPGSMTVDHTPDADYAYRTTCTRAQLKLALSLAVDAIDYPNFKSSIAQTKKGDARHDAYMQCWTALLAWQRKYVPRPRGSRW